MERLGFGELELSILKIVREFGRVTVREVYERLGSEGSYTTIMTVMSRLSDKGELTREKEGKQYLYWINSQNKSSSKSILKRIQHKIFGGKPTALVSYLLEDEEITDEDLKEIENLIQKKESRKKMDKISFFILNFFLNSVLMFFKAVLLIEGIIFLFRIPQGRVAAFLRMVPIFKLPFDLCLYDFSRWSYTKGINPFHCEEGTRILSVIFCCRTNLLQCFFFQNSYRRRFLKESMKRF